MGLSHITSTVLNELEGTEELNEYAFTEPTGLNDEVSELETKTAALNLLIDDYNTRNFVAANVDSFSISNNVVEVGGTVTAASITWAVSGTAVADATMSNYITPLGLSGSTSATLDAPVTKTTISSENFTLTTGLDSEGGSDVGNASIAFRRKWYMGVSPKASGYVSADLNGATNKSLDANQFGSATVNPTAEYIFFAFAAELGAQGSVSFEVGGLPAEFQYVETLTDHTNETTNVAADTDYYIYKSVTTLSGSTTVNVIASEPRLYYGIETDASPTIDEAFVLQLTDSSNETSLNNFNKTLDLSGANYFYVAIPTSFGDPFVAYTFWDDPTVGFEFDMTDMGNASVTDLIGGGSTDYNVLRTTNAGLGAGKYWEIRT